MPKRRTKTPDILLNSETNAPDFLTPAERERVENAHLGLGDVSLIPTKNIFVPSSIEELENPALHVLKLLRDPVNFAYTCKTIFNVEASPMQIVILRELWTKPFPMLIGSRGLSKSFCLGLYCLMRALFCQGSKIVIIGAAFRTSKVVFDYCETIWRNAPIFRDIIGNDGVPRRENDRCSMRIGESTIIALPLGTGEKIRGQRASILIAEEFASIRRDIFENVVSGFAAVSLSPVEKMKSVARLRELKSIGHAENDEELPTVPGLNSNQLVISGTAYYRFNHFYKEWDKYKRIIESKGDRDKLEDVFNGEVPEKFNWKDYSIIRIPVELIPEGFMDEKNISRARMTYHKTQFLMEMSAVFPKDSDGFYKRSLIETCVVGSYNNPICLPSCGSTPIDFSAVLQGEKDKKYVIAVDPASERDNCSIVILEVWPDHRRIVYCWTTTRKRHKARLAKHLVHEHDFFRYVAKTIRTLMKAFPCIRLAIDKMGGGISIMEALCDPATCTEGELPILPIIVRDDPKPTDRIPGLHIIEEIKFASSDWVIAANNGLKFDLESKSVLFPSFDAASLALAIESDKMEGRVIQNEDGTEEILYDTLEDCVMNIEELKDELASIVHTQTDKAGRDHWDTPNSTEIDGKKTKTKKDRYSALLMANASARIMTHVEPTPQYYSTGGFAQDLVRKGIQEQPRGHFNPPWYTNVVSKGSPGFIVTRR